MAFNVKIPNFQLPQFSLPKIHRPDKSAAQDATPAVTATTAPTGAVNTTAPGRQPHAPTRGTNHFKKVATRLGSKKKRSGQQGSEEHEARTSDGVTTAQPALAQKKQGKSLMQRVRKTVKLTEKDKETSGIPQPKISGPTNARPMPDEKAQRQEGFRTAPTWRRKADQAFMVGKQKLNPTHIGPPCVSRFRCKGPSQQARRMNKPLLQ